MKIKCAYIILEPHFSNKTDLIVQSQNQNFIYLFQPKKIQE